MTVNKSSIASSFLISPFKALPKTFYVLLLLIISGHFIDESSVTILVYNVQSISQGEYWRLFTCHILHTNNYHLLLNAFALVLLALIHRTFYPGYNLLYLYLFSAFFISVNLYLFSPSMHQYVGLSGVLHALLVYGALSDIKHKEKTGYLLLLGAVIKIAHEQLYGPSESLANLINASVAIDAHLWGGIAGLFYFVLYFLYTRILQNRGDS